ncbi:hypothetical protein O6H91_18G083300 [Diphasiastrum complanatum]|uniref:Uncharacterized protein n=1 Tax=Diphasiastrum complanatum TaxID=34168 RepID=A0ACC2B4E6_DIPCM|nr:hypothetical protein O6H91_18G083300 [Diphasiastrum complanatum]
MMAEGSALLSMGVPWPECNDGVFYEDVVKSSNSSNSRTLLEFYSSNYRYSASKEGWLQRIQNKQIQVDGEVSTSPNLMLRTGAQLLYHRLPWKEPFAPHTLHILFEDEHLLAINKPSGLQVLPGGAFQQRTVLTQLHWYTMKSTQLPPQHGDPSRLSRHFCAVPVHRLGRGTSGVLLCAKSRQAKTKLAADFKHDTISSVRNQALLVTDKRRESERRILKRYRALVQGLMETDVVLIDQPIGKVEYPGVIGGLHMATLEGKPSQSKAMVVYRNKEENSTLVEVQIFSGRPHQIRIHLASIGHPLVGDPLYVAGGIPSTTAESTLGMLHYETCAEDGGHNKPITPLPGDCGYHLHSHRLTFDHPITSKKMNIIAPPPAALLAQHEKKHMLTIFASKMDDWSSAQQRGLVLS